MPDKGLPTIVHLDADAFFVSVEQALDPSLKGRKCAVGGAVRGIISSASYEARACGVYTPMPTARALRVCPDLLLISHRGGRYGEYSRRMFELCETLTPRVQRNSIDEGYLDLGPCGYRTTEEIVRAVHGLQGRISRELDLPVSFGIAINKLVSQIASKARKPRGFVVVAPGEEATFLSPLPVGCLPGIGAKTAPVLERRHGIRLVGDLLARSEAELRSIFGSGWRDVAAMARGEDGREIATEREDAKSYSQQETFGTDIGDRMTIVGVVKRMIDELVPAIRADGKLARTLTVKVRYPDFSQESRSRSLVRASDLEESFYPLAVPLLEAAWTRRRPVRLVSVRFSGIESQPGQLEMFAETEVRRRRLAGVVDRMNADGSSVIVRGHQLPGENRPAKPGRRLSRQT